LNFNTATVVPDG